MHLRAHRLIAVAALCAPWPLHASPETTGVGVDLEVLDLNGAPFRSFHLGRYSEGLDARKPTAADPLPSQALSEELDPNATTPDTGVDAAAVDPVPALPDIAPLLDDSPDDLLHPAFRR